MDLYLVRHGETMIGSDGLYPEPAHLTSLGRTQADALAPRLAAIDPDVVITSGRERAEETAAPFITGPGGRSVSARISGPIRVPGLDEVGIGGLRAQPVHKIQARLAEHPLHADFSEFDGESPQGFAARVLDSLRSEVLDRYRDGLRVVAVIHSGPINVILDWIETGRFDGTLTRIVPHTSVTLIQRRRDRLHIVYEGDTSHLDAIDC